MSFDVQLEARARRSTTRWRHGPFAELAGAVAMALVQRELHRGQRIRVAIIHRGSRRRVTRSEIERARADVPRAVLAAALRRARVSRRRFARARSRGGLPALVRAWCGMCERGAR